MDILAQYPDAEQVVLDLLSTVATTVSALPPGVLAAPLIEVSRRGGSTDLVTDTATVVIQCYAPTRQAAWANALQCVQVILAARRQAVNGVLIDATGIPIGPQQIPYDDPNLRRVAFTARLTFRRP